MSNRSPLLVTAAVLIENGRVLVTRRREEDDFPLFWEFPGGKMEPGESPEAALERELGEELDISVRVEGIEDAVFHRYPDFDVLLLFYRCTRISGTPKPIACQTLEFCSATDLEEREFLPADRPFVERLKGRLGA